MASSIEYRGYVIEPVTDGRTNDVIGWLARLSGMWLENPRIGRKSTVAAIKIEIDSFYG